MHKSLHKNPRDRSDGESRKFYYFHCRSALCVTEGELFACLVRQALIIEDAAWEEAHAHRLCRGQGTPQHKYDCFVSVFFSVH